MSRGKSFLRLSRASLMALCAIALLSALPTELRGAQAEDEVWSLEHAYWRYVEQNDLTAYRRLWNKDFIGWPSVSAAPVNKSHITDWITSQTSQGLKFETVEFKPAAIQAHGNTIVTFYWITSRWVDKNGHGEAQKDRITHTWQRSQGGWEIIGGMSMPEAAAKKD